MNKNKMFRAAKAEMKLIHEEAIANMDEDYNEIAR
jgi:hypothetical protein